MIRRMAAVCVFIAAMGMALPAAAQKPERARVLDAMKRATAFMTDTVSCHGGYLWNYSADLSERWGEAPARPSQIWVQGSTPEMGELFLDAFAATGDSLFLGAARKVADALVYGQHPAGGWHYVIDFDHSGLASWYETTFSKFKWGMEEYRHNWGNCTYDDDNTQSATRFLLHLYMATFDTRYRAPLLKALDFMLRSQYPNGAWPQRYPLRYEFAHDGLADYTHYYTLNDNSMRDILSTLVEAWEKLGDERYWRAALRGADFIVAARLAEPQAGWAEQYDTFMRPAWARTHEPAGLMPRQTVDCIGILERFYLMTGDRRYLGPIPGALAWLKSSAKEDLGGGKYRLARYYEVGTNKPIYQHKTNRVNELGYGLYEYNDDPTGVAGGWVFTEVNVGALEKEYERVSGISPGRALAEYTSCRTAARPAAAAEGADPAKAAALIAALDPRGAWVGDVRVYDTRITMSAEEPYKTIKGIAISSFIRNMRELMRYVQSTDPIKK